MFRRSNTIFNILDCDLYCCLSTRQQPFCTEIALSQQLERSTQSEAGKKGAVHTRRVKIEAWFSLYFPFLSSSYWLTCLVALLGENRGHLLLLVVRSESVVTSCLISSEHVWMEAPDQWRMRRHMGRRQQRRGKLCVIYISSPSLTVIS